MSKRVTIGRVAPVHKGAFNLETSYKKMDVVTYNGSSYMAITDSVGVLPTDTTKWQLFAQKGDSPVKGTDYFTENEINEFKSDVKDAVKTDLDFDNTISGINQDISDLETNKADTSDIPDVSSFIDKNVNNLTNYYKKDEIYNKTEIDSKIASVYKYRDTVSTYNDLPNQNLAIGDVYNIENADATHGIKAGDNVAWNGTNWDVLAGTVDLSGYQTKIDSSHKLSADLIETNTNKQFVSETEKDAFNAKLDEEDLEDYVKNTDYANDNVAGVIKPGFGLLVNQSGANAGKVYANVYTYQQYTGNAVNGFISKGTLENVIEGKELVNKTYVDDAIGDIDSALDSINGEIV